MKYTIEFIVKYLLTVLLFAILDSVFNTKLLESDFTWINIVVITCFTTLLTAIKDEK